MKKAIIFLILIVASSIFGCTGTVTPTPLMTKRPSPTSRSTFTALPTATQQPATPAITPEPSLRTQGPYLAYFQDVQGIRRLVFMDADGQGRKIIDLPDAIHNSFASIKPFDLDVRSISPDGHWMAFHTGSAGTYGQIPTQGSSDLTLNLLDLTTGAVQVLTPLLSKDYPNNFVEAAEKLNDPEITAQSLYDAFITGITESVAWSPDGRYLAFAGQMDGVSSDLYVYDVTEKTIRRLSSGDQELQWIEWSPDGTWILHSGVFWAGQGMRFDIYAASLDAAAVPHLSTNIMHDGVESWLNPHQYLEHDGENVIGLYGLRLVDIDTEKITKLWDETFYSYAIDRSGGWVAVLDSPDVSFRENSFEFESDFVPGMYLIDLTTLAQSRVEFPDATHEYADLKPFGLSGKEFVMLDRTSGNLVFLSIDGRTTQTDVGDVQLSVSPNSETWIAVTEQEVEVFSPDNTLIKKSALPLPKSFVRDIIWRPDSSGLFLVSETNILSVNVPAGDITLVEANLMNDSYNQAYGWIRGE